MVLKWASVFDLDLPPPLPAVMRDAFKRGTLVSTAVVTGSSCDILDFFFSVETLSTCVLGEPVTDGLLLGQCGSRSTTSGEDISTTADDEGLLNFFNFSQLSPVLHYCVEY